MALHLHLDPFSGIAGDMFLGALLDLGVELSALERGLADLGIQDPYHLHARRVQRCGIGGIDFKVHTHPHTHTHPPTHTHTPTHDHAHRHDDDAANPHDHHHSHSHPHAHDHVAAHSHDHAHTNDHDAAHSHDHNHSHDHPHPHVGYRDIMAMVEKLHVRDHNRRRAAAVVTKLATAEARVHGTTLEHIHFHEVGAVDSIVDMLGGILALDLLGVETLSCGPLPVSRGYVRCDHGLMPVPAPATAYLLEGLPTVGVDRAGELVTPTGAALVAGLCDTFGPTPPMKLQAVGYGAGDRDDPDVPNLLRLMLGHTLTPGDLGPLQPAIAAADTDADADTPADVKTQTPPPIKTNAPAAS